MNTAMIAAISTNGYIAGPNGDVSWLSAEDDAFLHSITKKYDVLIMGSTTFLKHKNTFATTTKKRIVLTNNPAKYQSYQHLATFTNTPLKTLLDGGKKALVLGGQSLYTDCVRFGLVDTIYITTEPTTLATGTLFLQNPTTIKDINKWYELKNKTTINKHGTVVLQYIKHSV